MLYRHRHITGCWSRLNKDSIYFPNKLPKGEAKQKEKICDWENKKRVKELE